MSLPSEIIPVGLLATPAAAAEEAAAGYTLDRSLRFNSSDSAHLSKTFASAGSSTTWTFAVWVKKSLITTSTDYRGIFTARSSASNYAYLDFSDNGIRFANRPPSGTIAVLQTTPVFRDPSAWFHIVAVYDSANTTSSDRLRLYINGSRVTEFSTATYPSASQASVANSAIDHYIGFDSQNNAYIDGYLSDVHFIDGQALDPTSFGEFDTYNNWQPKAASISSPNNGTIWSESTDSTLNNVDGFRTIFDGSLATRSGTTSNAYHTLVDNASISASTGIRIYWNGVGPGQRYIRINGSTELDDGSAQLTPGWSPQSSFTGTINKIEVKTAATGSWALSAVEVDGVILVDEAYSYGRNGFHLPLTDGTSTITLGTDTSVTLSDAVANQGMDVVTYTGNGSTQIINTLRFAPDFVWIKSRSNGTLFNFLIDSVRGNTKELYSNNANAEATNTTTVTAFNSNGFSLGSRTGTNQSGGSYVAWCWKAGGPVTSNTDGTITSQVSANQDYGFSIVSYTGTGSAGSFGHGLAAAPGLVIIKKRTGDMTKGYWTVYHSSFSSVGFLELNVTGAFGADTTKFSSAPSSTVVNIGNNSNVNQSGQGLIAYCWSEVSGFSKFGSYTGTGSTGLKITTDFKPRYLLIKRTDAAEDWIVYDTQRDDNTMTSQLLANSSAAEATGGEVVSNSDGFTINATGTDLNTSGGTYIYAVFAAEPGNNWALNNFVADESASTGFKAVTYTGNGSAQTVSGLGFSPDLVWIKNRNDSTAGDHRLYDTVRGATKELYSNLSIAEGTEVNGLTAFSSDGFSVGSINAINGSSDSIVAWCWDAGNSTVSNTDGTITSSVRANTTLGFSVVTYTGNGTSGATVGHGLGATPKFFFLKSRTAAYNWVAYHSALGNTKVLLLDSTSTALTATHWWNDSGPSNTTFTLGNTVGTNASGVDFVAYCFAPKPGVSAMGSYVGNGSTSGPMVVTGFKPAFVMVKITDGATSNWQIIDNERSGNPNGILFPNLSNAEDTTSTSAELLSNGFKINNAGNGWNRSGSTYIYMAFAAPIGNESEIDSLIDSVTNGTQTDTGEGGEVVGNYATLNPLKYGGDIQAPTNGNLEFTASGSSYGKILGTIGVSSGKWYWECVPKSSQNIAFGITKDNTVLSNYPGQDAVDYTYHNDGTKYNNSSGSAYGASFTTNDVIGVAFDADNGTLTFYKNNSSQGEAYSGLTSGPYFPLLGDPSSTPDASGTVNFGQRPFAYNITKTVANATGAKPILSTSDDYGQTLSSGTASDSNSSSLVLALPMNGANGGTTFTDYSATIKGSGSAKTVTASGDAQTSTTESKWYGSSLLLDGSGDYLDAGSGFAVGTGDFTAECWARFTVNVNDNESFYSTGNAAWTAGTSNANVQFCTNSNALRMKFGSTNIDGSTTISVDEWYHVAVTRESGTVRLFLNGQLDGSGTATNDLTDDYLRIGQNRGGGTYFEGNIQDFRFYNGVAKYTSNFTPPSSALFKALCTANLDEPTVPDGSTAMDVALYTGNGSTQTISGLGFSPDFVWTKARSFAENNNVFDAVRGATKLLLPDSTNAEQTISGITSFTSDGYTLGSHLSCNQNNSTYVSWNWDAGSSTVSNTDGSITSSVRANPTAGFSVATFTGASTGTIGHGLGVAPSMIIMKARTSNTGANDWFVYHKDVGNTKALLLNSTAAPNTYTYWNNTSPTSTVFSIGSGIGTPDWVAYCFAPVEGYSAFGSYTGNGNTSGDGPFVYTGHLSRWLMIKRTDTSADWILFDTARDTYNQSGKGLRPNLYNAEYDDSNGIGTAYTSFDFLSNGFKVRGASVRINASGGTYIWASFAEHPFRTSRAR